MTERIDDDSSGGGNSGSYIANSRAPRDNTEYSENPGTITSDSLAAESLANNGSFAGNQSGVQASGQSSYGSTANTYDTSGADTLAPSRDAASRDDGGLDEYSGRGDGSGGGSYNNRGGNSGSNNQGGSSTSYSSGGTLGSDSQGSTDYGNAGNAPSAYSSAGGDRENLKPQPKGQNISEGGFDSGAPNASFNNDIGGKNDPGRVAEDQFVAGNARAGGAAGYEGANAGSQRRNDQGGFENLSRDEDA